MAKRVEEAGHIGGGATTKNARAMADAVGRRVATFTKELERFIETRRATTHRGMSPERLRREIARVRDRAADLLEQLSRGNATKASSKAPVAAAVIRDNGRSGGVVDAPGKRHRKPMPSDPGANLVDSQAAKMRTTRPMVKTSRHRGRG